MLNGADIKDYLENFSQSRILSFNFNFNFKNYDVTFSAQF